MLSYLKAFALIGINLIQLAAFAQALYQALSERPSEKPIVMLLFSMLIVSIACLVGK